MRQVAVCSVSVMREVAVRVIEKACLPVSKPIFREEEVAALPMGAKAEAPMTEARRTMVRNILGVLGRIVPEGQYPSACNLADAVVGLRFCTARSLFNHRTAGNLRF
jgi:hypothetical protein